MRGQAGKKALDNSLSRIGIEPGSFEQRVDKERHCDYGLLSKLGKHVRGAVAACLLTFPVVPGCNGEGHNVPKPLALDAQPDHSGSDVVLGDYISYYDGGSNDVRLDIIKVDAALIDTASSVDTVEDDNGPDADSLADGEEDDLIDASDSVDAIDDIEIVIPKPPELDPCPVIEATRGDLGQPRIPEFVSTVEKVDPGTFPVGSDPREYGEGPNHIQPSQYAFYYGSEGKTFYEQAEASLKEFVLSLPYVKSIDDYLAEVTEAVLMSPDMDETDEEAKARLGLSDHTDEDIQVHLINVVWNALGMDIISSHLDRPLRYSIEKDDANEIKINMDGLLHGSYSAYMQLPASFDSESGEKLSYISICLPGHSYGEVSTDFKNQQSSKVDFANNAAMLTLTPIVGGYSEINEAPTRGISSISLKSALLIDLLRVLDEDPLTKDTPIILKGHSGDGSFLLLFNYLMQKLPKNLVKNVKFVLTDNHSDGLALHDNPDLYILNTSNSHCETYPGLVPYMPLLIQTIKDPLTGLKMLKYATTHGSEVGYADGFMMGGTNIASDLSFDINQAFWLSVAKPEYHHYMPSEVSLNTASFDKSQLGSLERDGEVFDEKDLYIGPGWSQPVSPLSAEQIDSLANNKLSSYTGYISYGGKQFKSTIWVLGQTDHLAIINSSPLPISDVQVGSPIASATVGTCEFSIADGTIVTLFGDPVNADVNHCVTWTSSGGSLSFREGFYTQSCDTSYTNSLTVIGEEIQTE